jgi:hypothetical protein
MLTQFSVIHIGYNELTEQKNKKTNHANKVLLEKSGMHKTCIPPAKVLQLVKVLNLVMNKEEENHAVYNTVFYHSHLL